MNTLYAITGLFLFLVITCELYSLKTGVPTVTSTPSIRKKMIELLKNEAARHKGNAPFTILDLGSGTGKLGLDIGRALPASRVTGLEISVTPFFLSQARRWLWKILWKVDNVEFKREDFWSFNIRKFDAVVIYINGKIRDRMAVKLKEELRPGTFVISNETHLPGWEPIEVHTVGLLKVKVVVYRQT